MPKSGGGLSVLRAGSRRGGDVPVPCVTRQRKTRRRHGRKKEDIRDLWLALIKVMATPVAIRDDSLHTLWTGAAKDGVLPESLRREDGIVPLTESIGGH